MLILFEHPCQILYCKIYIYMYILVVIISRKDYQWGGGGLSILNLGI